MIRIALILIAGLAIIGPAAAAPIQYVTTLSGPNESPPVNSPGTGYSIVTLDTAAHTLRIQATFSGLVGTTTVAHIHAPTAVPFAGTVGVAVTPGTLPGFPVGVTAGSYDITLNTLAAGTYTGGFTTTAGGTPLAAEGLLASSLASGRAYLNIHSTFVQSGEIRGFFVSTPEPGTIAALGLLAVGGLAARRRRA